MKYFLLSFAFSLSLSASASSWKVVGQVTLPPGELQEGMKTFPLHLVIESKTKWDNPVVLKTLLASIQKTFKVCHRALGEVSMTTVELSQELIDVMVKENPYKAPGSYELAKNIDASTTVTGFLLASTSAPFDMAKAYTKKSVEFFVKTHGEDMNRLRNTFYISSRWVDNKYAPKAKADYSTLAHEVAHILGNLDHIDGKDNLMGVDPRSSKLNPEQCAAIQNWN